MRTAKGFILVMLAALFTAAAQSPTPRPTPRPTPPPNERPSVKLLPSADKVTLSCDEVARAASACAKTNPKVKMSAQATDPDGDTLLYTYTTTGGLVSGEGPEVTLDLSGTRPSLYKVTVEVDDGNGGVATDSKEVTVDYCPCDSPPTPPLCPTVTVSCPDSPDAGAGLTFKATVTGGDPHVTPTFNWTVSPGKVVSGQGTDSIAVDVGGILVGALTATVEVGGYDRSCLTSNSCTLMPGYPPMSRKIDEYGDIPVGDEKLRLDNIVVELQNDPTARLYLICYGGRRGGPRAAARRCERAKNYLISSRGVAVGRVAIIDGGYREGQTVEVWFVPAGAAPPEPSPTLLPRGRGRR